MDFSERELKYLQKLVDNETDLDLEIISNTINQKRGDNNKVEIGLLLSKLEELSNLDKVESINEDTSVSNKSKSKFSEQAAQIQEHEENKDKVEKKASMIHQILSELEPVIDHLLLPKAPKKYIILSGKTQAYLAQEVSKHIKMGWQPFGGVSAAAFGISPVGGNQYIQAMVVY